MRAWSKFMVWMKGVAILASLAVDIGKTVPEQSSSTIGTIRVNPYPSVV
jgi:hypothetical protein